MIEDLEPLEEDAVPIINVGGMEPVFAVREEDEELKLEEVEEPVQEETIAIEDERPPNLVNLLKDQELYAENPALEIFRPPPLLPSQQRPAPAAQPGLAGLVAPPQMQQAQPAPSAAPCHRRPLPSRAFAQPPRATGPGARSPFTTGSVGAGRGCPCQIPERVGGDAATDGGQAL